VLETAVLETAVMKTTVMKTAAHAMQAISVANRQIDDDQGDL